MSPAGAREAGAIGGAAARERMTERHSWSHVLAATLAPIGVLDRPDPAGLAGRPELTAVP